MQTFLAGMVKLVDTLALGASALVACWFKSSSRHHKTLQAMRSIVSFCFSDGIGFEARRRFKIFL